MRKIALVRKQEILLSNLLRVFQDKRTDIDQAVDLYQRVSYIPPQMYLLRNTDLLVIYHPHLKCKLPYQFPIAAIIDYHNLVV